MCALPYIKTLAMYVNIMFPAIKTVFFEQYLFNLIRLLTMNTSDLVELKYLSEAASETNVWSLTKIVNTAVSLNEKHSITGILFFDHGYFGQIMEGQRVAVEETWNRIKNDPRHHQIELLEITEIEERRFPTWSMKLFDAHEFSAAFPKFATVIAKINDPHEDTLRVMKSLWSAV
jgi:hypothetical protein